MGERLRKADALRYALALGELASLTTLQSTRLRAICALLDFDGKFNLKHALLVGRFPTDSTRAQDAFLNFRKRLNESAEAAGVNVRLELDSRKTTPDRRDGWFSTGDLVHDTLAAHDDDVDVALRGYARLVGGWLTQVNHRLDKLCATVEDIAVEQAKIRALVETTHPGTGSSG